MNVETGTQLVSGRRDIRPCRIHLGQPQPADVGYVQGLRRDRHEDRHLRLRLPQPVDRDGNRRRPGHRGGGETSEYFVYGQATLPDEVAPWDRAATDARDIGQITLRLEGNRDFTDGKETADIANRYLWGPAVDQILADEQISARVGDGRVFWPLADHQGTAGTWRNCGTTAPQRSSNAELATRERPRRERMERNRPSPPRRQRPCRRPPLRLYRAPHRRGDRLAEQPQPVV